MGVQTWRNSKRELGRWGKTVKNHDHRGRGGGRGWKKSQPEWGAGNLGGWGPIETPTQISRKGNVRRGATKRSANVRNVGTWGVKPSKQKEKRVVLVLGVGGKWKESKVGEDPKIGLHCYWEQAGKKNSEKK